MQYKVNVLEGLESTVYQCTDWKSYASADAPKSVLMFHRSAGRSFTFRTDGTGWRFEAKQGRFDYYPAGRYEALLNGPVPMDAIAFMIPASFENTVLEEGRWAANLAPRFQFQDWRLEQLMKSLYETSQRAGANAPGTALLSVSVVDRLYQITPPKRGARPPTSFSPTIQRLICRYIDDHLSSCIDVEKVAILTGLGRTQFNKNFRQSFGTPFHQYVIAKKVETAAVRLRENTLVTQLSHELGFSSHAHFTTVFKQHMGITPSEFRRTARS
jgi:AraC-like DNA-binding protein